MYFCMKNFSKVDVLFHLFMIISHYNYYENFQTFMNFINKILNLNLIKFNNLNYDEMSC